MTTDAPREKCWRHDYAHREYVCRCDPPVVGDTGTEADAPRSIADALPCGHHPVEPDEPIALGDYHYFNGMTTCPGGCGTWVRAAAQEAGEVDRRG